MWQPTEYDRWYAMQVFRPDLDRVAQDAELLRGAQEAVLGEFELIERNPSPRAHLQVEAKQMAKEGFALPDGFRFEGFASTALELRLAALGGSHPTDEVLARTHNEWFVAGLRSLARGVDEIGPSMTAIEKAAAGQTGQVITIGSVTESSMHAAVVAFGIALLRRVWVAMVNASGGAESSLAEESASRNEEQGTLDPTDVAILRAIRGGQDLSKLIAEHAKTADSTVRRRMQRLKGLGLVEGEKPYRLTANGQEAVSKVDRR